LYEVLPVSVNDLHQGLTVANDQAAWFDADCFFPFHRFEFLIDTLAGCTQQLR
jgi:hypothetical protein